MVHLRKPKQGVIRLFEYWPLRRMTGTNIIRHQPYTDRSHPHPSETRETMVERIRMWFPCSTWNQKAGKDTTGGNGFWLVQTLYNWATEYAPNPSLFSMKRCPECHQESHPLNFINQWARGPVNGVDGVLLIDGDVCRQCWSRDHVVDFPFPLRQEGKRWVLHMTYGRFRDINGDPYEVWDRYPKAE